MSVFVVRERSGGCDLIRGIYTNEDSAIKWCLAMEPNAGIDRKGGYPICVEGKIRHFEIMKLPVWE